MRFPKRKIVPPKPEYWMWQGIPIPASIKQKTFLGRKKLRNVFHKIRRRGWAMLHVDDSWLDFKIAMEHEDSKREPKYLVTYINRPRPHGQLMIIIPNKPKGKK